MATKRKVTWIERDSRGTHYVRVPFVLFFSLLFALTMMTIILWSIWRENATHLRVKNPGDLDALLPSIVGLTESSLDPGNRIEVLENGDQFFPSLLHDIAAARETVHLESYIWWRGQICDELAMLLAQKAKQGVEVRVLIDASGGHKMTREVADAMTHAGVHLV